MSEKITAVDRRRYKKLLLAKRLELCGDVDSMESQALRAVDQLPRTRGELTVGNE